MAVAPLDIPITREQVSGWLKTWKRKKKATRPPLRDYLLQKIKDAGHEDLEVDTTGHDTLRDATPLVDMILMDLPSYGYGPLTDD